MPNSFATSDWVSMECLRFLQNMLMMAGYANFGYQDEFKKAYAVGDTVTIKLPQEFLVQDGFDWDPQGINRQTTTVTVDQPMSIQFEYDSIEQALYLERSQAEISEQYIQPAIGQLAQAIETRFMDFAFYNTPNVVGTLGAVPTAMSTYSVARTRMVQLATWGQQKNVIGVTPDMQATMIANSTTIFNPTDEISRQYKTGSIGRASGFEWFETMSARRHTTGIITTQTAFDVGAGGQSGSSIAFACTTGDTLTRGDILSIADVNYVNPRTKVSVGVARQFKVMAAATGAASAVTLSLYPSIVGPGSPYQNVDALPAAGAAVTFWPGTTITDGAASTGSLGMAFNKLAFAIAGVDLMMPATGGTVKMSTKKKDPNTGITIGLISDFDTKARSQIQRLDCLIGFGPLYADKAAVLIASLR